MSGRLPLRNVASLLLAFCAGQANSELSIETLTRDGVEVVYAAPVTETMASEVADRVMLSKRRVLAYLRRSAEYPDDRGDVPIRVLLDPDATVPSQMRSTIFIPQQRVLEFFGDSEGAAVSLAVTHEVTHVLAVSARRSDGNRFLDDGLAVFLQTELDELPAYPNFHQGLHIAAANAAMERGGLIALDKTEATRRKPPNGVDLRMAYLQQGSFTQFLLESYGLEAYLSYYYGQAAEAAFGRPLPELDAAWRLLIQSLAAGTHTSTGDGTS